MSTQFRIRSAEFNTSDTTNLGSSLYNNVIPFGCSQITNGIITSNQLLNIQTNPVQVLPPLSSGAYYIINLCILQLNFNTIAYVSDISTHPALYYGNTTNYIASGQFSNAFISSSNSTVAHVLNGITNPPLNNIQNQGIYLNIFGTPVTSGNSSLYYLIYYTIVNLPSIVPL